MVATFLQIHHDVDERHLRATAAKFPAQGFKVPSKNVLVEAPEIKIMEINEP